MSHQPLPKILFVCMGNICRSPTAEGIFRTLAMEHGLKIEVDSAGTLGYHSGEKPDQRAQDAALNRGYDLSRIKARKVKKKDFTYFDKILAMDNDNLENLKKISPDSEHHKIELFLDYASHANTKEVPDPYYGSLKGFDRVIDLIEDASKGLIESLVTESEPS